MNSVALRARLGMKFECPRRSNTVVFVIYFALKLAALILKNKTNSFGLWILDAFIGR